jgi:transcriptional regulator with XRE-family HTH domain
LQWPGARRKKTTSAFSLGTDGVRFIPESFEAAPRLVKRVIRAARQSGIGKSQLSKYENGRELPKLDSLEKVLTTLGVSHEGFSSTLATIDRWAAGRAGASGAPETPTLTSTSVKGVDHAFGVALYHLAVLQRAFLEALLLPSLPDGRETDASPAAGGCGDGGSALRDPSQEPAASSPTAAG